MAQAIIRTTVDRYTLSEIEKHKIMEICGITYHVLTHEDGAVTYLPVNDKLIYVSIPKGKDKVC